MQFRIWNRIQGSTSINFAIYYIGFSRPSDFFSDARDAPYASDSRCDIASVTPTISRSYKGFRRSFVTPICGTVKPRSLFGESALRTSRRVPKRLFPCFKDSHAMRKCTLEGGLHVVSTLLPAAWFHLRRHSTARSYLNFAEDVVVPPPSQTLILSSEWFIF